MEYLPLQHILYVTKKKYSRTTSKQQTQFISFMKRFDNNLNVEYTDKF